MKALWNCDPNQNSFPLPHEVFELDPKQGALLVYLYLIHHKYLKHSVDKLNCTSIGKAVGLCAKTVRTHLCTLVSAGLIQAETHGCEFSYVLCPIQDKVHKDCNTIPLTRKISWRSKKQKWLTGEVFKNVFSLPNEVFQLGLRAGELLVYIYLLYCKNTKSDECYPSYSTIGEAVGMTKKTVQKHVGALIDKGLVRAENTTVRWRDGRTYNGNLLYTLKPIKQLLREREKEMLAKLKLAAAQRKWDERVRAMTPAKLQAEKSTTL